MPARDYLQKPVEPERLARALQRVRDIRVANAAAVRPQASQLLVPDRGRTLVLPVAKILWLEAADNYVVLHTEHHAPLLRRTLAALLHDLGSSFVRTHRGAAVAPEHVTAVLPREKGDATVILRGGGAGALQPHLPRGADGASGQRTLRLRTPLRPSFGACRPMALVPGLSAH